MTSLSPIKEPLNRRKASHLLKRLSFGPNRKSISALENKSIDEALNSLLKKYKHPLPPLDTKTGKQWISPAPLDRETGKRQESLENTLIMYTRAWWLDTMIKENTGITEKMAYFYHSHFTTAQSKVHTSLSLYHQLSLFRHHALGNIKELARKLCIDNAMLLFLDGNDNENGNSNENFAREFFELYTIGKGPQVGPTDYTNYTEQDIREAGRIFTGFKTETTFSQHLDPDTGVPLGRVLVNPQNQAIRHDSGEKQFSHRFGNKVIKPKEVVSYHTLQNFATKEAALEEVRELVDMIFAQKETARHLCRKLYRFFVYYRITPETERNIIEPLANTLYSNNYEMLPVLKQLFSSQHFFDQNNKETQDNVVASLIKSPLEIVAGTLRFFEVNLPDSNKLAAYYNIYESLIGEMARQGLDLYEPFEVAGHAAYHQAPGYNRNWISSNNLACRYEFADILLKGISSKDNAFTVKLNLMQYVKNPANISDPADAEKLARELIGDLLPEVITENRMNYFLNDILLENLSPMNWKYEWEQYKKSNNDEVVRRQLEKFVRALLQSPEYQLS